ncbi:MAG: acyl carrier protein [Bacilli bacterium]|nr:acyl carrier protein [Bacilli bacterium]
MFRERLNLESLDEASSLASLGLDSLDVVDMCLDVEEKFGIQFEMDELAQFKTVGDLFNSIEAKLQAKA